MVHKGLKMGQTTPKRHKMMPKRSLSDPKVTPVRPKNGAKSPQNGPILVHKWSYIAPDMVKNGSKWGFKSGKNRLKVI